MLLIQHKGLLKYPLQSLNLNFLQHNKKHQRVKETNVNAINLAQTDICSQFSLSDIQMWLKEKHL